MAESPLKDDPALVHLIALGVILFSGLYMAAQIPQSDISDLIYAVIDSSGINTDTLLQVLGILHSLPVNSRVLAIFLIVKGFSYLKVAPIVLFGFVLGKVDAKIRLCEPGCPGTHSSHSVRTYHTAKRILIFSILYLPVLYISFPVESMLHMSSNFLRYSFVSMNSAIGYYAVHSLAMNKPPRS